MKPKSSGAKKPKRGNVKASSLTKQSAVVPSRSADLPAPLAKIKERYFPDADIMAEYECGCFDCRLMRRINKMFSDLASAWAKHNEIGKEVTEEIARRLFNSDKELAAKDARIKELEERKVITDIASKCIGDMVNEKTKRISALEKENAELVKHEKITSEARSLARTEVLDEIEKWANSWYVALSCKGWTKEEETIILKVIKTLEEKLRQLREEKEKEKEAKK